MITPPPPEEPKHVCHDCTTKSPTKAKNHHRTGVQNQSHQLVRRPVIAIQLPATPRRTTCSRSNNSDREPPSNSAARLGTSSLSSGEAELYATGRAAAGGLQSVQLLNEAGMDLKLEVLTDSTANLGMHNRIGSGRVRHLDVKWLWTQEAVQAGRFSLKEVGTHSNVSDLTTKHPDEERLKVLMTLGRLRYTRGRTWGRSLDGQ